MMASIYKNRRLVHLSIIFFFYFSSIGCLAPFLTSHMRQLGFSLPEVSFINAIAAFMSLIGPIIGGVLAEKHSKYKCVTIFFMLMGSLAFCALTFVPKAERLHYKPLVDFSCRSGLRIERCVNWADCSEGLPIANSTTIHLVQCKYQCSSGEEMSASTQPLHICFNSDHGNICVVHDFENSNNTVAEFETQLFNWPFEEESRKSAKDNPNETKETDVSGHDVFIPTWLEDMADRSVAKELIRADVAMCNYHPSGVISFNQKPYSGISCRPKLTDCAIHCQARFSVAGKTILPNSCEEANGDPTITFWSYIILRSIGDMCILTSVCLLDALIASNTRDFEGAYGRIHIWPALALAAFAPFSGAMLDYFTDMGGRADFSPSVFVSAGLTVLTCAVFIALPISHKKSSPQFEALPPLMERNRRIFTFELFAFLTVLIVLGMQWGVISTFLPWMTMDIGCSGMVTGLAYTFIFGCCLPFLLISKNLVRNIGRANLLVFAFLFYGTRYAGVSFVFSTWWTLPFAAMGSFTLCVMWIAAVAYGQSLVPPNYHIMMQYALNILHFGIGRGLGSLLGGTLIAHHGQRVMFRGVAVFSAFIGFLYLAIYHLTIRKRKSKETRKAATNGGWYPLNEQRPNGDSKSHHSMFADQDDDSDIADEQRNQQKRT